MRYILLLCVLALAACGAPARPAQVVTGVWRNNVEKLDYHFGPNEIVEVVGAKGSVHSMPCTFSLQSESFSNRTVDIWFKCPQPDWPGYAESHELIFSEGFDSFVDTMYIQGIPERRYDGEFVRITP